MISKRFTDYFTKGEIALWSMSVFFIVLSFVIFDRESYMTLAASVIGTTSLIFCAKGNPVGQVLIIIFSVLYGIISHSFAYYGEMITYLGMTAPMALFSLIAWLRNPYNGNRAQVKVNSLRHGESAFMLILSLVVTVIFYFILEHFGTSNIIPSTISVTTSFIAAYLTLRRSPYFALAYAANDIVLIVLWAYAAAHDRSYISVIICFAAFLANDLYGFYSWRQMQIRQSSR
ncbi:MAG: nicotinamide mononucleotide transporter [Clostridia bacterium]|nr:nicotinamide mononucleotide transporter [Clostridia bacterium]